MTHGHNLLGEPPATLLPGIPEADAALAAERIGEVDEQERCSQLLRDCDPTLAP
jgi:hypothetical protein